MKNSIDIMRCKLVKESELEYDDVISSETACSIFRSLGLGEESEEVFWLLCLNAKGAVAGAHMISRGDLSSSLVHPREVYKRALLNNACSIIVAHNHPSMDSTPSTEDHAVTNRLSEAGKILGIKLLDHIIIGSDSFSFAANGLL